MLHDPTLLAVCYAQRELLERARILYNKQAEAPSRMLDAVTTTQVIGLILKVAELQVELLTPRVRDATDPDKQWR